ncbi:MAG: D-tyrosyl-tRNA(Tyr) deacylase [Clostridiales bacterium]|nr:D-tyrosyl-tRNA(Tyr) deacylase [Clostridiales bacterium]
MRAIVQRVNYAKLTVEGEPISQIGEGYLVLVGYTDGDTQETCRYIVDRIIGMRIFKDDNNKLNKTLSDVGGEVMVVSNFTLYGNAFSGRRPDFSKSAKFDVAKPLYDFTVEEFRRRLGKIATGVFGAHMHIDMSNDGPITMILEK